MRHHKSLLSLVFVFFFLLSVAPVQASNIKKELKLRLDFASFHSVMTKTKINLRKKMDDKGKKIIAFLLPAKTIFEIRIFRAAVSNYLEKNELANAQIKKAHEDYAKIYHDEMVNLTELKGTAEAEVSIKFWEATLAYEKEIQIILLKKTTED